MGFSLKCKYLDETYKAVYEYIYLFTCQIKQRTLNLYKHKEHWSGPTKIHGERWEVATWEINDNVLLNGKHGDIVTLSKLCNFKKAPWAQRDWSNVERDIERSITVLSYNNFNDWEIFPTLLLLLLPYCVITSNANVKNTNISCLLKIKTTVWGELWIESEWGRWKAIRRE